jgi:hypothetical protein
LTISPIRDGDGKTIGASKIARDISDRKRAAQNQDLLLREMHHRVKNGCRQHNHTGGTDRADTGGTRQRHEAPVCDGFEISDK